MASTGGYFGKAEYDFAEPLPNELPLCVGDVVFVTQSIDSNWSEGILVNSGTKGRFPANFVSPLVMPTKREPSESVAIAIEDFKTAERGDLRLDKGAVIVVSRVIDDSWLEGGLVGPNGRLTGTKGIFPKSFVVDINKFSAPGRNDAAAAGNAQHVQARVIADLKAKLNDEIDLKKNEWVSVLDSTTEWCTVETADGRRGTCPKPFLAFDAKPNGNPTFQQPTITAASSAPQRISVPQYASDSLEPYGRTKFAFHGEYAGELSFTAGRIVKLLRYVDDEWLEGELDGKTGIFPVSYVDTVIDCPLPIPSTVDFRTLHDSGYTSTPEPGTAVLSSSSSSTSAINLGDERVAVFDFAAAEQGDLTVHTGDIVHVVETINADWMKCRHSTTGRVGLVPANFLSHRDTGTSSQDVAINWRVPPAVSERTSSVFRYSGEMPVSVSSHNRTSSSVLWHAPHSIDSPISFSSSRAASPMLQPVIIPADEFVKQQYQTQQKSAPPPRPATQPTRLSASTLAKEKEAKELERGERMKLAREKIAQDLVKSEMQFVADLRACDSAIRADTSDLLDKNVLLAGYSEVIDLAAKLLNAFQAEYAKDDSDRAFGSTFLRFQPEFSQVYGKYWECSDIAAALLEKYDQDGSKKDALKACLKRMQANGCSCIDVHSAVCRPVQRLLKYPLFLGEMLKCADIRHPDHPKLMEAVKQMSNLAQSMNESKRQKDIVLKYRKEKDQTISDRLSKFNLHTMKKKGSRFSYRLTSTMGITHLERDEAFEAAENDFRATDKLIRTLLRDVHLYCDRIQHLVVQQVSLSDAWKEAFGVNSYERLSSYRAAWVRCVDVLLPTFFSQLNDRVKKPLEYLLKLFDGPSKLIAKRVDKLMDYEAVKSTGDGKSIISEQERIKKGEYEALNGQLKAELPTMVTMSQSVCRSVQEALLRAQKNFYSDLRSAFSLAYTGPQPTRRGLTEKFDQSYQIAFEQLRTLASVSVSSKLSLPRQRSTDQPQTTIAQSIRFKSSAKSNKVHSAIDFPMMRQTDSHRQSLRSKYAADKLFVVTNDAPVTDEQLDLAVSQGDIVVALIKKDPMGNSQRWYCDNGVAKGFIATDRLQPLSERPSGGIQQPPTVGQIAATSPHNTRPSASVSLIDFSSPPSNAAGDRRSHAEDLLGLEFTPTFTAPPISTIRPHPPPMATTMVQPTSHWQTAPPTTAPPRPLPANVSRISSVQPAKTDPFQELWQEAKKQPIVPARVPRAPQPTIPTRPAQYANVGSEMEVGLTVGRSSFYEQPPAENVPPPPSKPIPVRSAPPPPPPSVVPSTSAEIVDNVEDESDVEFYIAEFDFDADDPDNQLSLAEGQMVAVHAKHDQSGNDEWWLVEDEFGGVGYFPSNYLSPYST